MKASAIFSPATAVVNMVVVTAGVTAGVTVVVTVVATVVVTVVATVVVTVVVTVGRRHLFACTRSLRWRGVVLTCVPPPHTRTCASRVCSVHRG